MTRRTLITIAACALAMGAAMPAALAAPTKTIADLEAAYLGETTAHAKYAAYAKQAAREGHRQVAVLFRAASTAEAIHARNHRAELAQLGVKNPKAGRYVQRPGTTAANLKDAIKGETYEKDVMYPRFLRDAEADGQTGAIQSFSYALAAEKQHAQLYRAALKSLGKEGKRKTVAYVCPVCGGTYASAAPGFCPVCATPAEKFRKFV